MHPLTMIPLVLSTLAAGSTAPDAVPAAAALVEQRAVRAVVDDFFTLAQRRDWDGVSALLADDFEIFTDGAAGFAKAEYSQLLKADDLIVEYMELKDVTLRVSADASMAWVKYRGSFVTTSHGVRQAVDTAETMVFQKEPGGWKIVRAHASIRPAAAAGRCPPGSRPCSRRGRRGAG